MPRVRSAAAIRTQRRRSSSVGTATSTQVGTWRLIDRSRWPNRRLSNLGEAHRPSKSDWLALAYRSPESPGLTWNYIRGILIVTNVSSPQLEAEHP